MGPLLRILFVRTDRLGDVLMNLPAIRLLRQTHPKAWIAIAADRRVAEILKGHPDLDEIITLDHQALKRSLAARFRLLKTIREAKFDTILVSNPSKLFHAAAFFSGASLRLGYGRKWGFFLNRKLVDDKDSGVRHEIDSNIRLVQLIAAGQWDGRLTLESTPQAMDRMKGLIESKFSASDRLVAIHPGASRTEKRWPVERFVEVAKALRQRGFRCILIGGAEERSSADQMIKSLDEACLNLVGETTLGDLVALFKMGRIEALLSADSGPVHVAWICGTPVLALYAKNLPGSDPARWGPRDARSRVIFKAITEITPGEVTQTLFSLLDEKEGR